MVPGEDNPAEEIFNQRATGWIQSGATWGDIQAALQKTSEKNIGLRGLVSYIEKCLPDLKANRLRLEAVTPETAAAQGSSETRGNGYHEKKSTDPAHVLVVFEGNELEKKYWAEHRRKNRERFESYGKLPND